MRVRFCLLLSILFALLTSSAFAAVFTVSDSEAGYTLNLPGTWKNIPHKNLQEIASLSLALGIKDTSLVSMTPPAHGAAKERGKAGKALLAVFAADYFSGTQLTPAQAEAVQKNPHTTIAGMVKELNDGIASTPECKKLRQSTRKDGFLFCYSGAINPTDPQERTTRCMAYRFTKKHMITVVGQFSGKDDPDLVAEMATAVENMDIRRSLMLDVAK